jgi:hypothetical protein
MWCSSSTTACQSTRFSYLVQQLRALTTIFLVFIVVYCGMKVSIATTHALVAEQAKLHSKLTLCVG